MREKKSKGVSKEILNTREAAALLKVTTQTIKNYIYSGKLKAIKTPGGHHRIRRSDLKSLGFVMEEDTQKTFTTGELWDMCNGLIEAFTKALDSRDIINGGHSARVAALACDVGSTLGLSTKQLQELRIAAMLHDVGKIGISESILGKPGRLTDQEFFLVRQHPEIGAKIVMGVESLRPVADAIRQHHERFDGKGYPYELGGGEINLYARIISVVEAFDFLRSDLSFRRALSVDDSVKEIQEGADTQFDPEIVRAFSERVGQNLH